LPAGRAAYAGTVAFLQCRQWLPIAFMQWYGLLSMLLCLETAMMDVIFKKSMLA
jgi:hypothetical protein